MNDKPKTAIRIEGGSNIRVENNVSVGYDHVLSAKDVTNLSATGNVSFSSPKTQGSRWYNQPWLLAIASILGALLVAYAVYRLGW